MPNFFCEICDFVSSKESNLHKHFSTRKHHGNVMEIVLSSKKMPKNATTSHDYRCANCDRNFTTNSGLWKHKKVCINAVSANENKEDIAKLTTLITQLMTQNTELIKKIGTTNNITATNNTTNNTTNTNNINKSKNFNIQFFLNETCKDALNISEFVDSLKITLEDLDFSRKN